MLLDVVATSRHVVHDGICVDSDTCSSACLDHVAELLSCATSTLEFVRDRLVIEPPWVELTILRPFVREYGLHGRENFHTHPSLLRQVGALLLDISMGPSKQLYNTALLSILVNGILIDELILPREVHWFERYCEVVCAIASFDCESERLFDI